MWRSLLKSFPLINQHLGWTVGRGTQVYVGIDPILGLGGDYKLSHDLISALHRFDIYVLKQASSLHISGFTHWSSPNELRLDPLLHAEWELYINRLFQAGIILSQEEDKISWVYNKKYGNVSAQLAYDCLMESLMGESSMCWRNKIWSLDCPL